MANEVGKDIFAHVSAMVAADTFEGCAKLLRETVNMTDGQRLATVRQVRRNLKKSYLVNLRNAERHYTKMTTTTAGRK